MLYTVTYLGGLGHGKWLLVKKPIFPKESGEQGTVKNINLVKLKRGNNYNHKSHVLEGINHQQEKETIMIMK